MLSWYPYVPIGGEMGVNTAILSYNGNAYFGFSCDVGAVPDPENLEKFVRESFAELCETAKRVKPRMDAAEAPQVKTGKSKRVQPQADIPVPRKRARPNAQIPVAAKPKRTRKIPIAKESATAVAPATIPAPVVESEEKEQRALAAGA